MVDLQDLIKLIQEQEGSTGIVYAHMRKTCDFLATELGNAGVDAAAYHAGQAQAVRLSDHGLSTSRLITVLESFANFGGQDRIGQGEGLP